MAEKKCSKCGEIKPLEQFYRMKARSDGRGPWCKVCMNARRRLWAEKNPERERAIRRAEEKRNRATRYAYRQRPERKAWMQKYSAEWHLRNKERLKPVRSAWHAKNKERRNAEALADYYANKGAWRGRAKAWAKKHPERWREFMRKSDNKRRAAKAGSVGCWTEADVRQRFSQQRGKCAVCRCNLPKSFHRDHIVPLASGGSNDKYNLQLLCKSCNSRKHKKDPIQFMQENGYLL